MRLTFKLFSLVAVVMVGSLAIFGYSAYRSEMQQFETDLSDKSRVLGRAMSAALTDVWRNEGEAGALRLVRDANAAGTHPRVGWVWVSKGNRLTSRPSMRPEEIEALRNGREVVLREPTEAGTWYIRAYFPMRTPGGRTGALELSEPSASQRRFARRHSLRLATTALLILLVAGGLMAVVGEVIIGGRVRQLGDQARRIGEGELSFQVSVKGNDELSRLARAMNTMARHLNEMRDGLRREHEAHVKTIESLRHAERLATLGQLASGVAHELGTPLNVVAGRAKLIAREKPGGTESAESATIIAEQAARMTEIIQRLLEFARRRAPRISEFDVPDLIRKVREMMGQIAGEKNVAIEIRVPDGDTRACGDPSQIRQVLVNLILNGVQSMPDGGKLTVTSNRTRARPPDDEASDEIDCVRIEVRDQGVGIAEEDLPHVTEPYFTTKPVGAGTGLGLSIVNGIVEEHGGWIDIRSSRGSGTCVAVYLPVEGKA
jgi:signal transduction histidine kinase